MKTIADVFIIESLDPDDEGNGRLEGVFLAHILRLHGKAPQYRYVRTRDALNDAVLEFAESHYRYLHISSHGDSEGLVTTNQEEVDFDEFAEMLQPHMQGRRLFLSACSTVHEDLAKALIPPSGCYSVVGPTENIRFTDAAIVWGAVYHLMFTEDAERMTRRTLKEQLAKVCDLFGVKLAFFSKSEKLKRGYTRDLLSS
ncbi:hypothetical protein PXJ20_26835 [Paraburkholderia sp. A1RI_3L]|uniref:hypothetical protein n=1 Tax=Paraburkholderia TaxID=1822464 RepID=UPI003B7C5260